MNGSPPSTICIRLISRRTLLRQLGATGLLLALWPATSCPSPEAVQDAIRQRIGARQPQPGGMTLTLPKIAETGNSVPLTVTVDSP
jgi:sulfur-oxidizing protein SoxY